MPPTALARLRTALNPILKARRTAALAAALALVILGMGMAGVRQLKADTTATDPATATSPSPSSLPASNAGPKNIVQVKNFTDNSHHVEGRVQLGRVPGPGLGAVNLAFATSSCTDCQTLAVALQINLFNRNASVITPQNAAVAVNGGCTRCDTIAYAVQYNIGVDDPIQVPPRVDQLVADMKRELAQASAGSTSLAAAEAEINQVISQYQDLANALTTQRNESLSPDAAPSAAPAAAASPPAAASPTPAASPDSTPAPAASPSPSPAPTPSPSPTASTQPSRIWS